MSDTNDAPKTGSRMTPTPPLPTADVTSYQAATADRESQLFGCGVFQQTKDGAVPHPV